MKLKQRLKQENEQQKMRESRRRLMEVRKEAGVDNDSNEWDGLTTDFRGYPMAVKRSKVEGFNDQHVIPTYLFSEYILTAEQEAYIARKCKELKTETAVLFQNQKALSDLGFRKKKLRTLKEDTTDYAVEETLQIAMQRLDLRKDLMKLFYYDNRYSKRADTHLQGSSDSHLQVRPLPGVSYNVQGVKIKGGRYVNKGTKYVLSKTGEQSP